MNKQRSTTDHLGTTKPGYFATPMNDDMLAIKKTLARLMTILRETP